MYLPSPHVNLIHSTLFDKEFQCVSHLLHEDSSPYVCSEILLTLFDGQKLLILAETVNSQVPHTHSSSIMHNFADCGYIPLNCIFFTLKSPCIVTPCLEASPCFWSSLPFLPEPWPVLCLSDEDQTCTEDWSPGSTTETPTSCTVISLALFSTPLLIIFLFIAAEH